MEGTSRATRRAVIVAGLGVVGAATANALARPIPARAGHGAGADLGALHLGEVNNADSQTDLGIFVPDEVTDEVIGLHIGINRGRGIRGVNSVGVGVFGVSLGGIVPDFPHVGVEGLGQNDGIGVRGQSKGFAAPGGAGAGVKGESGSGPGVEGEADDGPGVQGHSQTGFGVEGFSSGAAGVIGQSETGAGVEGFSNGNIGAWGASITGRGVYGTSWDGGGVIGAGGSVQKDPEPRPPGPGVIGLAPGDAPGVLALSASDTGGIFPPPDDGVALQVVGKALFSTAGAGVIRRNMNADFVAEPSVTAASHITVTLTEDPGNRAVRWVERLPGNGFRVHLSPPTSGGRPRTSLTYLVVEPFS